MEKHYTVRELADILNKSEDSIRRYFKSGQIEFIQVSPRCRLVRETVLNDFLESRIVRKPNKIVVRTDINHVNLNPNGSLTTEDDDEMDVKSLRREISRLWQ